MSIGAHVAIETELMSDARRGEEPRERRRAGGEERDKLILS